MIEVHTLPTLVNIVFILSHDPCCFIDLESNYSYLILVGPYQRMCKGDISEQDNLEYNSHMILKLLDILHQASINLVFLDTGSIRLFFFTSLT